MMRLLRNVPLLRLAVAVFALYMISSPTLDAQVGDESSSGANLKTHKFQPAVPPEQIQLAAPTNAALRGIGASAVQQMKALIAEKQSRTPAQKKVDSNVLATARMLQGQPVANGVPYIYTGIDLDDGDNMVVDITANVTDQLLEQLRAIGARLISSRPKHRNVRAVVPPSQIESVGGLTDVIYVGRKQEARVRRLASMGQSQASPGRPLAPGFEQRAAKVRGHLAALLPAAAHTSAITLDCANQQTTANNSGQGSVTTQGDLTHCAAYARATFGVTGAGVKIGVLSDGVTSLSTSQASGNLPPTCGTPPCVTVLPGKTGSGDEGTALLEIIHDLAPGAQLFFATANSTPDDFAANINALRTAGCDIILDDIFYTTESPFQDGQTSPSDLQGGVVTQAVNDVVTAGALYFSAGGNGGNLDNGTFAGTYEGSFNDSGGATNGLLPGGTIHDFGGVLYDTVTIPAGFSASKLIMLNWADPLGGSNNDYDLFVLNSSGSSIVTSSTNTQDGTQDPHEEVFGAGVDTTGNRIVVWKATGAANRFFHLDTNGDKLAVATSGEIFGHPAASKAFAVAAAPAATAFAPTFPIGPFPHPFTPSNLLEPFSSDGLRRIFFDKNGNAINGTIGTVLIKPEFTAADGVRVSGAGGFSSPFYGTSAAAPHAGAIAALVMSADLGLRTSLNIVVNALLTTTVDIMAPGLDRDSGAGIVMAHTAVNSLVNNYAISWSQPTPAPINAGGSVVDTLTITPNPSFGSAITFTCSVLPAVGATTPTCHLSPTSVAAPGVTPVGITVTVNTTAPTAQLRRQNLFYAAWLPCSGLGLIGIVFIGIRGRDRKTRIIFTALLLLLMSLPLIACGSGGSGGTRGGGGGGGTPGTPAGAYNVTVVATSTGVTTRSAVVTVTVN